MEDWTHPSSIPIISITDTTILPLLIISRVHPWTACTILHIWTFNCPFHHPLRPSFSPLNPPNFLIQQNFLMIIVMRGSRGRVWDMQNIWDEDLERKRTTLKHSHSLLDKRTFQSVKGEFKFIHTISRGWINIPSDHFWQYQSWCRSSFFPPDE